LAYVVHYFGAGSAFEGKSTRAEAGERRTKVEKVVAALRATGYDIDVVVCGIPGSALIPVDLDLSGSVTDPRHLVYAAIQHLAERAEDGFDYFLCVEDDILVPEETIDRMIRFQVKARVNEVLLPNRLDESPEGVRYCMDLVLVPGWRGLRRKFERMRLGVANNPHSGLAFLSREQIEYASQRVDLARREQFLGGPMASAFANLHQPFLLWRTRGDLERHHVLHLDQWQVPGVAYSVAGVGVSVAPEPARGRIDEIVFDGVIARVRGWLGFTDGRPVVPTVIRLGTRPVDAVTFSRHVRPDVPPNVPGISENCGFVAAFSLLDLTDQHLAEDEICVESDGVVLKASWPVGPASVARDSALPIPDDPHLPGPAGARFRALLTDAACYLEYGTGGSTMLASRAGVPLTYCVESDASWLAAVDHRLRDLKGSGRHVLLHADIGPTGERGFPKTTPVGTAAGDYALDVWRRIEEDGAVPDVVLVDGRYRVASCLASMLHARTGTPILFDDYLDRPHYNAVEEVVAPLRNHDRLMEFVVPEQLDRENAWRLLARYAGDPR
jgi:hypothetical protein